jgi:hypothetical protein
MPTGREGFRELKTYETEQPNMDDFMCAGISSGPTIHSQQELG